MYWCESILGPSTRTPYNQQIHCLLSADFVKTNFFELWIEISKCIAQMLPAPIMSAIEKAAVAKSVADYIIDHLLVEEPR